MLKTVQRKKFRARDSRFAIVASQYNARYVDAMVRAARAELKRAGAKEPRIIRVPGAYEIPLIAASLANPDLSLDGSKARPDAIICLGVILRGETVHAAHIGEAVSRTLMDIQLRYRVPVVHEVLLLENHEQARKRCLSRQHNRGTEAAQTALAMAKVVKDLHKP